MRTTLSLDEDVAISLHARQKERDMTFKQVVNEALREGLVRLGSKTAPPAFRTQAVDLGTCKFPDLDNIWEVLDQVEGIGHGR